MASLLDIFADAVRRGPKASALVDGKGHETSFEDLQTRINALAGHWRNQDIGRGDRVLIAMPLGRDLYASLAALWSLGATVVLPEPAMGLAGLRHAARHAGVTAFCTGGLYGLLKLALPALWPLRHIRVKAQLPHQPSLAPAPLADSDIALISFTSGTSGRPKAIPRSHGFLLAQYAALTGLLDSPKPQRDLVAFPVFALINLAAGRCSVLPNWKISRPRSADAAQISAWITRQRITRALLPPSICETLSQTKLPDGLAQIFTGGGPVFPAVITALQAQNPTLSITCVYGSTEAEPIATLPADQISAKDLGLMLEGGGLLAGIPHPDLHLRIKDDEIQVAGAHVNQTYLDPADDAGNKLPEGDLIWHRTGDAGRLDDQGRLWLLGRLGSQVTIQGHAVFPFAVEAAARQWPGVRNAALMARNGAPLLVLEGAADQLGVWQSHAGRLGVSQVVHLPQIPMDRRHGSKVDRTALNGLLDQKS